MFPTRLYTGQQCRDLDLLAINQGIDGYTLMCRAAAAALDLLLQGWSAPEHIHVVCGAGNNGGDGLVLARLAQQQQLPVTVYFLGEPAALRGEARQAWQDAVACRVSIMPLPAEAVLATGIIVDALLGIGVQGKLRDSALQVIDWINASGLPVLALDLPSGICADTGSVSGSAVRATKTITFIAAKRGLYTAAAVDHAGEISVADLALPEDLYNQVGPTVDCLEWQALIAQLPARPRNAHKGLFGHVLVIGGNTGMAGAVLMAATAAARSGAGLVSVATLPEHVAAFVGRQPEIMVHGITDVHQLAVLLEKASVVAIGPGLGQDAWAQQMLYKACNSGLPLVLDADALNLLSATRVVQWPFTQPCILTPHPGEAARLLACDVGSINANRFQAAQQLQQRYQATVILKGAGTVIAGAGIAGADIASAGTLALSAYGNAGMASGGMGDVLTGVIAGLLAQGLSIDDAARLAVLVHASAADKLAAENGQRGLLATDLIPLIRQLLNAA